MSFFSNAQGYSLDIQRICFIEHRMSYNPSKQILTADAGLGQTAALVA